MFLKQLQIKRVRLLTFDAFGTLFNPREPISKQYGDAARQYRLQGFTDDDISISFRNAFKTETNRNPNYGKAVGMKPPEWWATVIRSTFLAVTSPFTPIPEQLISDLLTRFSSSQGYKLYPDVLPFFNALRNIEKTHDQKPKPPRPLVGIITNSDDRVPLILSSLGLNVGMLRHGLANESVCDAPEDEDINFVVLSYDVGFGKPHRTIFDAARVLGLVDSVLEHECLHIGDNIKEDYQGARDAGWKSLLLDRERKEDSKGVAYLTGLAQLGFAISSNYT